MNSRDRAGTFTSYVGLELKGKIASRGFTAVDVAHRIGRSPAAFNRWINGKTELPLSVLCEGCEVIDVEPSEVVEAAYSRLAVTFGERDGSVYRGHGSSVPGVGPDLRLPRSDQPDSAAGATRTRVKSSTAARAERGPSDADSFLGNFG